MGTKSLLVALVGALALGVVPAGSAGEAANALANMCTARGGTTDWAPFPGDTTFCRLSGGSSDDVTFDTHERASQGFLGPEKVCAAAGGQFGLIARATSGGTLIVFGWGCRFGP